ncbi:MAG: hypothetical protein SNJ52_03745, partial [Verrucomicrobiia bacterium]
PSGLTIPVQVSRIIIIQRRIFDGWAKKEQGANHQDQSKEEILMVVPYGGLGGAHGWFVRSHSNFTITDATPDERKSAFIIRDSIAEASLA